MRIDGAIAVVTGASSGIGRATALALVAAGARVVLAARREGELAAAVAACREAGGEADLVVADVAVREDCFRLMESVSHRFGRVDILVNNAGFAIFDPVADAATADLEAMMRTNYFGTLFCCQAVLPQMLERGSGAIVNVSSIAGEMGFARMGGYCATKFAVNGMTEALRSEVAGSGVSVSMVCPGTTRTDFFSIAEKGKMPAASRLLLAISPERVARAVVRAIERGSYRIILPPAAATWIRFKEIFPRTAHLLMRLTSSLLERRPH